MFIEPMEKFSDAIKLFIEPVKELFWQILVTNLLIQGTYF